MITSIAQLCREKGVKPEATIYGQSSRQMLDFQIVSGDFYRFVQKENGKYALRYKECVEIFDFPMLSRLLLPLRHVNAPLQHKLPYFTAGMSDIAEKMSAGEQVAVEGGPCLFGTDEVMAEVLRKDGTSALFDYNTGKSYLVHGEPDRTHDFREFVTAHATQIAAVHFQNRKKGLTLQEWLFVKYPFEVAKAVSAPLVMPIPDMSYVKYLDAVLKDVDKKVRQNALEEFRAVGYEISRLYLELIARMRDLYREVYCEVVHERETRLCQKFYEARSPFMERNKILRGLTGIPEKLESIKDYVSMPALPYYLFGIRNVIEVDSMDETDSFRKCRKAHKGSLTLACILLPELLSGDQVHTIFDAPWERKEYGNYVVE